MCCSDVTGIWARIVAVLGLLCSAVVMVQLATELVRGEGQGRVAVLLGMSLDEFGSRQRHTPHYFLGGHLEHKQAGGTQHQQSEFEYEVLLGFLVVAILYGLACALLAYASIFKLQRGAIPWLVVHALCIASQAARLVVMMSDHGLHGEPDHLVLSPHPEHPDIPWEADDPLRDLHQLQQLLHREEDRRAGSVVIALSTLQLLAFVYMWLVVMLVQREWSASRKPYRPAPAVGDEGFGLGEVPASITCSQERPSASMPLNGDA